MELREALSQISEIRERVAATERFRGYRAFPIGMTGLLAIVMATLQPNIISQPSEAVSAYIAYWMSAAIFGIIAAGVGIWLRHRGGVNRLSRELTLLAVGQFMPCIIAGGFATIVIMRFAPNHSTLLPSLWQLFFSLGIFASCRLLPKSILIAGVWYFSIGIWNMMRSETSDAFSPWVMGIPFGLGQIATAGILYWNLERNNHDNKTGTA